MRFWTTVMVLVLVGVWGGAADARSSFVPENAFTQDNNTVMLSHFDGNLREEVSGTDWDFGSFNGTNKDLSGSYVNFPQFSNGYGKCAGQGIQSAGTGGNGGLRFPFTRFLNIQKWPQGTVEWWEVYQVQLPNTQNNCTDFAMLNEDPYGGNYHRWTQFNVSQERYDGLAYIGSGYNPAPDVPPDILQGNASYLTYSTLLTAAIGKGYIAGQERHHIAVTWGPLGLAWWIDGKKAWSNPADTGAVYNPYWSGMHYYNNAPYDGFQDGAIYLGCSYDGQMSNQVFDEFRFSDIDRYGPTAFTPVGGTITLQSYSGDAIAAQFQLRSGGIPVRAAERKLLGAGGSFSLDNVTVGSYDVVITVPGWQTKVVPFVVGDTDVTLNVTLNSGDLDGDGEVTSSDLSVLLNNLQ